MKPGLLERIQEMAHWRVLIRPALPLEEELGFGKCLELVNASKVSVRGWDYPHVDQQRPDGRGGIGRGEVCLGWKIGRTGRQEAWASTGLQRT